MSRKKDYSASIQKWLRPMLDRLARLAPIVRIKHFLAPIQKWLRPKIDQMAIVVRKKNFLIFAVPTLLLLIFIGGYAINQSLQQKNEAASQSAVNTAVVRRGNLVISAGGTGSVIAAAQASLQFQASGQLTEVFVKAGEQVKAGQVLAQLDNTTEQAQLAQAKQALAELTSAVAVTTAKEAAAQAQLDLNTAYYSLAYLISDKVLLWEERVGGAQRALAEAQMEAKASPSTEADRKVKNAESSLKYAQAQLGGAEGYYKTTYLPDYFTVKTINRSTHTVTKYVAAPSRTGIEKARSTLDLARATLVEAKDLVTALQGGNIPENATGPGLASLRQAQLDLETAQNSFDATRLVTPISGTVISVSAQTGDTVSETAIITVADLSRPCLDIYIDESDWSKIAVGEEVNVTFDALPGQTFTGRVTQVFLELTTVDNVPAVHGQVELDVTSASPILPIGLNATVEVINAKAENALLVPVEALKELEPGNYAVFVQENGQLKLKVVQVGLMDESYAEIKSGLAEGDVVSTGLVETSE